MTKNLFTKAELEKLRELPSKALLLAWGWMFANIVAFVRFTTTTHRA